MNSPSPLREIRYTDRSGYATHLQIEVTEYIRGTLTSSAFMVAVQGGLASVQHAGLVQVFDLAVQPVISHSPSEIENLGPPLMFRAPDGNVLTRVELVTTSGMIRRTMIQSVDLAPVGSLPSRGSLIPDHTLEVTFQVFDYHDESDDESAEIVDVLVLGVKEGQFGQYRYRLPVSESEASLSDPKLSDISRLEFTPYTSPTREPGKEYGSTCVVQAGSGLYLDRVEGVTRGARGNPQNSAVSTQRQPTPPVEDAAGGEQNIEIKPRSGSTGAKTGPAPERKKSGRR